MEIWIIGMVFTFFYWDIPSDNKTIAELGWKKGLLTIFGSIVLLIILWPALCGTQLRKDFKR